MSESITVYDGYSHSAEIAVVRPKGQDYAVACGNAGEVTLKRDVDFGVIPKTKKPTLFKSGAEKICMGYKLLQQYELVHFSEGTDKAPVFRYIFKCNLVALHAGHEHVVSCGYGSANTAEKRNGFNGPYDADNGTIKMAQKRALVAAALAVSGLSDAFTQDMENEDFMEKGKDLLATDKPDSPVSTAQIRRLYAIGGEKGLTTPEVKQILAVMGFTSTKQILQKDYDAVCDAVKNYSPPAEKESSND